MKVLDLFCGAGGASMGYWQGFLFKFDNLFLYGVDNKPQKNYPFHFIQRDALEYIRELIGTEHNFDFIHASPPCQQHSVTRSIHNWREYPDYILELRELLKQTKVPYVIENVVGAPLENPIRLCGAMFGLRTYRHRLFETSFLAEQPKHLRHEIRVSHMGRVPNDNEFMSVVGHFSGVDQARKVMEIDWMTGKELAQAIPPAYTKYIAEQYLVV